MRGDQAQELRRFAPLPLQSAGALARRGSAGLCFESVQNWQSEFLSAFVLIVIAIYLREKGSPESRAVGDPNDKTGAA
jgi:hypothetical protein